MCEWLTGSVREEACFLYVPWLFSARLTFGAWPLAIFLLPCPCLSVCVCVRCTRSLSNAARKQGLHNQKNLRLFPAKWWLPFHAPPTTKESPWQSHPGLPKPRTPSIVDGTASSNHVGGSRRPDHDLRRVQTRGIPVPTAPAFLLAELFGERRQHHQRHRSKLKTQHPSRGLLGLTHRRTFKLLHLTTLLTPALFRTNTQAWGPGMSHYQF